MADLVLSRDFDPHYGRPVRVAPGVRRVTAQNPGPFTFAGTNSYIVGAGRVAVIDPGPNDDSHFRALMAATAGEAITHILVTHAHRDHSAGLPRLAAATGAQCHGARRHGPAPDTPAGLDAGIDRDFVPDIALADGELIAGDGWRIEAVATPGHAPDHLAFALAGAGLLFSGDHVMGWSTTVVAPPEGVMADYMASLDRLLARPEDTYFPGHGGPVVRARDHVQALKEHRLGREAAILHCLAEGTASIPAMVAEIYPGLDPALVAAAGLSVLAHLEHLIARGRVVADGPLGPTARFRLTLRR